MNNDKSESDIASMTDDYKNAIQTLINFSATYTCELQSKMRRLDEVIGRKHWLSVGAYKEALIRRLLAQKVPRRFEVSTGFILSVSQQHGKIMSRQLDVLIWDSQNHAPFFQDGDFVIVPPEACVAAIEVKSKLTRKQLDDALTKLDSLTRFQPLVRPSWTIYKAVFAFDCKGQLRFPKRVFDILYQHYLNSPEMSINKRLEWMRESGRPTRHLPLLWVDNITILGAGVVAVKVWNINSQLCICYAAFNTKANGVNDTYGYLERELIAELLVEHRYMMHVTHSGASTLLFHTAPTFVAGESCMLLPLINPSDIRKIGVLNDGQVDQLRKRVYTPS